MAVIPVLGPGPRVCWPARKATRSRVQAAFAAARPAVERMVRAQRENPPPLVRLVLIDALLGRRDDALRQACRVLELSPLARDRNDGAEAISMLARVSAYLGDKDAALEQLQIGSALPAGPSYGELRFDPDWEGLRGDPRFDSMIAKLAPKEATP